MVKDTNLAVKVSKMYYENDLTFTEIGKKLKLSRFQVANIIKMAKKEGIVKILIDDKYLDDNIIIGEELEKEFGIDRVIVVDSKGLPEAELRKRIGYTAADLITDILKDGDTISFTTSSTVNSVASSIINKNKVKNIMVVEANGGSDITYNHSVHEISRKFSDTFDATHYSINAPIIVGSKSTKDILLGGKNLKKIFSLFKEIDILVFGIGTFYPKVNRLMLESGDLHKDEFIELKELNAAGNLLYYYYDIEGNFLRTNFNERIICLPIKQIRKIPYNIGVVYGREKKYGVLGALRTNLIKFLIIDSQLAEAVLMIKNINGDQFQKLIKNDKDYKKYINNI